MSASPIETTTERVSAALRTVPNRFECRETGFVEVNDEGLAQWINRPDIQALTRHLLAKAGVKELRK